KRGGGQRRVLLDDAVTLTAASDGYTDDLLSLNEALTRLEEVAPEPAQPGKLRDFCGWRFRAPRAVWGCRSQPSNDTRRDNPIANCVGRLARLTVLATISRLTAPDEFCTMEDRSRPDVNRR